MAFKIHYTKEGVKNKMYDSFEGMLKSEDDLKLIEDDHNNAKKSQNGQNGQKKN
jgi:hypothetical protein